MSRATIVLVGAIMGGGGALVLAGVSIWVEPLWFPTAVLAVVSLFAFGVGGWLVPDPETEDLTEWEGDA